MTQTLFEQSAAQPEPEAVEPLLEISELGVSFITSTGEVKAVRDANLTIYPGQSVAIVGESGSGKSTTAHAIINLLPGTGKVTHGTIRFEGKDITNPTRKQIVNLRGSEIGLVPQDPMSNLNPVWKIGTQVKEALTANNIAKGSAARQRVAELLKEAGLPDAERRARQYPHEFSGGMRQRALIAMGLAARPKLLIADEPTSALDVTVQRTILDHLEELTQELGTAVLFITHDLGLAAERAEHLVVMYQGRVVESGPARQILQAPKHPYTQRLVASAPSLASRRIESARERGIESDELLTDAEASDLKKADDVVRVENLTRIFTLRGTGLRSRETFKAVDDVTFGIKRGTTMAVVGESGSGKSTVANMVLQLLPPSAGKIYFDGQDMGALTKQELFKFRRRVQPIFQNPYGSLDPMYSIYRTIEEPLRTHGIGDRRSRHKRVNELLDMVAMPAATARRYPNELSGGQRQRIAIARALALSPEVVVCDEAVSALDVLVQAQILTLLNDLQEEFGLSYLFITHDLAVVRQIADEVCVMKEGRIVETASTDDVFGDPQEAYTQELLDAIPGAKLDIWSK